MSDKPIDPEEDDVVDEEEHERARGENDDVPEQDENVSETIDDVFIEGDEPGDEDEDEDQ